MKRIVLALVAPAMLLSAPGIALAAHHHGHGRHAAHHARRHARRARHGGLVRFGDPTAPAGPRSGTPSGPTGTAPTGATPTTPTPPTGEPAGKVLTFENGVLTIELTGGTKVSGQVTEGTRLICVPATPPPSTGGDDQGGGDDAPGVPSGEHGGPAAQAPSGGWGGGDNQQGAGNDGQGMDEQDMDSEDDDQQQGCETSALIAGAVVREAELNLSSAGAVWERVVVVH
jgi:hypothetical protein